MLPSSRQQELLEEMTEAKLEGSERRKFERYEKRRCKSVMTVKKETAGTRTVTVVEDLNQRLLKSTERTSMPKVKKDGLRSPPKDLGRYILLAGGGTAAT